MLNLTRYTESNNNITKFIVWFMNEHSQSHLYGSGQRLLHSALEVVNVRKSINIPGEELRFEAEIDKLVESAYFVTGAKIISIEDDVTKSTITLLTTFLGHKGYPGGEYDKDMGTCNLKFDRLTFVLLMSEYMSLLNSGKYKPNEYNDGE
jgi:hypothetical protein